MSLLQTNNNKKDKNSKKMSLLLTNNSNRKDENSKNEFITP